VIVAFCFTTFKCLQSISHCNAGLPWSSGPLLFHNSTETDFFERGFGYLSLGVGAHFLEQYLKAPQYSLFFSAYNLKQQQHALPPLQPLKVRLYGSIEMRLLARPVSRCRLAYVLLAIFLFKCHLSHSATDGRIATRIVAWRPSTKKYYGCKFDEHELVSSNLWDVNVHLHDWWLHVS